MHSPTPCLQALQCLRHLPLHWIITPLLGFDPENQAAHWQFLCCYWKHIMSQKIVFSIKQFLHAGCSLFSILQVRTDCSHWQGLDVGDFLDANVLSNNAKLDSV
jgi:hypothetical protein